MKTLLKIVVADDSNEELDFLRKSLRSFLPEDAEITEFSNLEECMKHSVSAQPDLLIIDNCFPDSPNMSGCKAAKELWQHCVSTAIIIQSGSGTDSFLTFLAEAVPEKASYGFLLKRNSNDYLPEAVQSILLGDCWYDPDLFFPLSAELRDKLLTRSEAATLFLSTYQLSPLEIAKLLRISPRAADFRLRSLRKKLLNDSNEEYSALSRIATEALSRGILTEELISEANSFLQRQARKHSIELRSSLPEIIKKGD